MENALEVKSLTKKYRSFTLDQISFSLPRGCIMGLIGENGAGKSTTIKAILGLIHKDSGSVEILGQDMREDAKVLKEQIGVVMDENFFPENLSAKDIGRILGTMYRTWNPDEYRSCLSRFSLPETKSIKEYSRGMKMKLAIATALSHGASFLILDEATSGLDPIIRDEMLDVFLDFIQDERHAILISSHILSDLEKICDYITFIHEGNLLFCQPKDELSEQFRLIKCADSAFQLLNPVDVIGYRKSQVGVEALVYNRNLSPSLTVERPTIEDIMLYHVRRNGK